MPFDEGAKGRAKLGTGIKQRSVSCCQIQDGFDEEVVMEKDAKLMSSFAEKELESVKDKLKDFCKENRMLETKLQGVKLRPREPKTEMEKTKAKDWDRNGVQERSKD